MNEQDLILRLQQVEVDLAQLPGLPGADDRQSALQDIVRRREAFEVIDPPMEHHYRYKDPVVRRLVTVLLRRYGLTPYRYPRQTEVDVMVRISMRFELEVFDPVVSAMRAELQRFQLASLERVAEQALHWDISAAGESVDDIPRTRNRR